jgi:hypothetical protein
MKHEGTYSDAVFIAPKIYGLYNNFSMPIIKTKGLKNPVSFFQLKNLLYKDNIYISHNEER